MLIRVDAIPVRRRIILMLAIRITGNQLRAGRALAFDSPAQWLYRASGLANGGRPYCRRQLLANAAIAAWRRLVAVDRRAVFVMAIGQRP